MSEPIAYTLWVPGVNCHVETIRALKRVGAKPELILLSQLLTGKRRLYECDVLTLPGGFGFGDDVAAGRILAVDLTLRLADQLYEVVERRIPVLGICNGFQDLVEMGLLPGDGEIGKPTAVLDYNLTARFEHWAEVPVVLHEPEGVECVWTDGLDGMEFKMPSAHGQGRLVAPNGPGSYHVIATYGPGLGDETYIGDGGCSPNGSAIAGIGTKYIAGLMPHQERTEDVAIFEAGVRSVR
ncbi:MAG: phosphoribosylformylglycinamidine synthase subunit PurQ [Patescibacteria group bacterium]|jgi:phosphoribosylformylglycinamidine synthase